MNTVETMEDYVSGAFARQKLLEPGILFTKRIGSS